VQGSRVYWLNSLSGRAGPLWRIALPLILALVAGSSGCAALTNPAAEGIPVRLVPPELLAHSKAGQCTLPLHLLQQPPSGEYRVAPGDVLGIFIDGFLGETTQPIPSNVGGGILPARENRRTTPSIGYPVQIQEDGRIDLPTVGPLLVQGMTLHQVRTAIFDHYVRAGRIQKAEEATKRVIVTLAQPRQYSVVVVRQEAAGFAIGPNNEFISSSKRGTGFEIDLPAYENDVLHALARTGGLAGLDAYNEVLIFRGAFREGPGRAALLHAIQGDPTLLKSLVPHGTVTRIPLRLPPGHVPNLHPEDIVLNTGDVVFLEARDEEVFYTAGLLPPAKHILPRDQDLDVLSAVAAVRGPLINGAVNQSNLNGTVIVPGPGQPSPSLLTVIRRTPNGGQIPILVDLDVAVQHPEERILVKGGDMLILQEKPEQALARYFYQTFLNFNVAWQVVRSRYATGILDVSAPDRLPGRLATGVFGTDNIPTTAINVNGPANP
jgi:protein involved in polysaccharide export with SLBB domain